MMIVLSLLLNFDRFKTVTLLVCIAPPLQPFLVVKYI